MKDARNLGKSTNELSESLCITVSSVLGTEDAIGLDRWTLLHPLQTFVSDVVRDGAQRLRRGLALRLCPNAKIFPESALGSKPTGSSEAVGQADLVSSNVERTTGNDESSPIQAELQSPQEAIAPRNSLVVGSESVSKEPYSPPQKGLSLQTTSGIQGDQTSPAQANTAARSNAQDPLASAWNEATAASTVSSTAHLHSAESGSSTAQNTTATTAAVPSPSTPHSNPMHSVPQPVPQPFMPPYAAYGLGAYPSTLQPPVGLYGPTLPMPGPLTYPSPLGIGTPGLYSGLDPLNPAMASPLSTMCPGTVGMASPLFGSPYSPALGLGLQASYPLGTMYGSPQVPHMYMGAYTGLFPQPTLIQPTFPPTPGFQAPPPSLAPSSAVPPIQPPSSQTIDPSASQSAPPMSTASSAALQAPAPSVDGGQAHTDHDLKAKSPSEISMSSPELQQVPQTSHQASKAVVSPSPHHRQLSISPAETKYSLASIVDSFVPADDIRPNVKSLQNLKRCLVELELDLPDLRVLSAALRLGYGFIAHLGAMLSKPGTEPPSAQALSQFIELNKTMAKCAIEILLTSYSIHRYDVACREQSAVARLNSVLALAFTKPTRREDVANEGQQATERPPEQAGSPNEQNEQPDYIPKLSFPLRLRMPVDMMAPHFPSQDSGLSMRPDTYSPTCPYTDAKKVSTTQSSAKSVDERLKAYAIRTHFASFFVVTCWTHVVLMSALAMIQTLPYVAPGVVHPVNLSELAPSTDLLEQSLIDREGQSTQESGLTIDDSVQLQSAILETLFHFSSLIGQDSVLANDLCYSPYLRSFLQNLVAVVASTPNLDLNGVVAPPSSNAPPRLSISCTAHLLAAFVAAFDRSRGVACGDFQLPDRPTKLSKRASPYWVALQSPHQAYAIPRIESLAQFASAGSLLVAYYLASHKDQGELKRELQVMFILMQVLSEAASSRMPSDIPVFSLFAVMGVVRTLQQESRKAKFDKLEASFQGDLERLSALTVASLMRYVDFLQQLGENDALSHNSPQATEFFALEQTVGYLVRELAAHFAHLSSARRLAWRSAIRLLDMSWLPTLAMSLTPAEIHRIYKDNASQPISQKLVRQYVQQHRTILDLMTESVLESVVLRDLAHQIPSLNQLYQAAVVSSKRSPNHELPTEVAEVFSHSALSLEAIQMLLELRHVARRNYSAWNDYAKERAAVLRRARLPTKERRKISAQSDILFVPLNSALTSKYLSVTTSLVIALLAYVSKCTDYKPPQVAKPPAGLQELVNRLIQSQKEKAASKIMGASPAEVKSNPQEAEQLKQALSQMAEYEANKAKALADAKVALRDYALKTFTPSHEQSSTAQEPATLSCLSCPIMFAIVADIQAYTYHARPSTVEAYQLASCLDTLTELAEARARGIELQLQEKKQRGDSNRTPLEYLQDDEVLHLDLLRSSVPFLLLSVLQQEDDVYSSFAHDSSAKLFRFEVTSPSRPAFDAKAVSSQDVLPHYVQASAYHPGSTSPLVERSLIRLLSIFMERPPAGSHATHSIHNPARVVTSCKGEGLSLLGEHIRVLSKCQPALLKPGMWASPRYSGPQEQLRRLHDTNQLRAILYMMASRPLQTPLNLPPGQLSTIATSLIPGDLPGIPRPTRVEETRRFAVVALLRTFCVGKATPLDEDSKKSLSGQGGSPTSSCTHMEPLLLRGYIMPLTTKYLIGQCYSMRLVQSCTNLFFRSLVELYRSAVLELRYAEFSPGKHSTAAAPLSIPTQGYFMPLSRSYNINPKASLAQIRALFAFMIALQCSFFGASQKASPLPISVLGEGISALARTFSSTDTLYLTAVAVLTNRAVLLMRTAVERLDATELRPQPSGSKAEDGKNGKSGTKKTILPETPGFALLDTATLAASQLIMLSLALVEASDIRYLGQQLSMIRRVVEAAPDRFALLHKRPLKTIQELGTQLAEALDTFVNPATAKPKSPHSTRGGQQASEALEANSPPAHGERSAPTNMFSVENWANFMQSSAHSGVVMNQPAVRPEEVSEERIVSMSGSSLKKFSESDKVVVLGIRETLVKAIAEGVFNIADVQRKPTLVRWLFQLIADFKLELTPQDLHDMKLEGMQ